MKTEQKETIKVLGLVLAALIAIVLIIGLFVPKGEDRCEKILLGEMKDGCYLSLAEETGNPSFCDRIGSPAMRDACISELRVQPQTSADCEKLSNPVLREQCIMSLVAITRNASYCSGLSAVIDRDTCYLSHARSNDDPISCVGISTYYLRMTCNNDIYTKLAVDRRNPSFCNQLVHNDSATRSMFVDNCIYKVAKISNDTLLCSGISNSVLAQQCVTGTVDFSACDQVTDLTQRSTCIFSLAVSTDDPSSCDRIPTPYLKDNCYYQMAVKTMNPSLCSRISGENLRSVCERSG